MSKIFLGGPISNAMHDKDFDEKTNVTNKVFDEKIEKEIIDVYGKLKSEGYEVLSAHISENFGRNPIEVEKMFVVDTSWIYKAENAVFVLYYNKKEDCLLRTDGSYIEMGICYERNIPITIVSNAPEEKLPTMLRSMIHNSERVKFITIDEFLNDKVLGI